MLGFIYIPVQQIKPPEQLVQSYANGVTIKADKTVPNLKDQTVEWIGGVRVSYGPTTVYADRVTMHNDVDDPFGEAIGNVRLEDPEGTITAGDLNYHWLTHTGFAHTVTVRLADLTLMAESADLKPDLWALKNVGGTGCKLKTPLYYIHTRELLVYPNQKVRANRPSLSILGQRLITVPYYQFSVGGGSSSIHVPYPAYRTGQGFGLDWTNEFQPASATSLFTKYVIFRGSLPFYNASLIHSFVKDQDPDVPRTEIGDRLGLAYFDSVQVRDPQTEQRSFGTPKLEIGLASTFGDNGHDTRATTAKIDKPIEFLGQASNTFAGFGMIGIVRAQDIRVGNGSAFHRLILEQNIMSPILRIGSGLYALGHIDAAEYSGGNNYNWLRGQAGVVYQPSSNIRLGASYTAVKQHGTSDFAFDEPFRFREIGLRADFDFDTTQIRFLWKYDPTQRAIYDREFYASRVVGCLEPYLVYRERPRKFFVGIKLPLSRTFERLFKVASEREEAIRHTISGPKQ
jgi:hypothetical protein